MSDTCSCKCGQNWVSPGFISRTVQGEGRNARGSVGVGVLGNVVGGEIEVGNLHVAGHRRACSAAAAANGSG